MHQSDLESYFQRLLYFLNTYGKPNSLPTARGKISGIRLITSLGFLIEAPISKLSPLSLHSETDHIDLFRDFNISLNCYYFHIHPISNRLPFYLQQLEELEDSLKIRKLLSL